MILKILKVILILVVIVGFVIVIGNIKFTEVSCVSQIGDCDDQIQKDLRLDTNPTFFTAQKKLSSRLDKNIFVEKYTFQYVLPTKLTVYVIQKKPFFAVQNSMTNQVFLLDFFGVVLSETDESTFFPVQTSDFSYGFGEKVGERLLFALKITAALFKTYDLEGSVLKSELLEITLDSGIKVIFPLEGDLDLLTGSFVLMYNQLNKDSIETKIDNNNIGTIDLRFRNPVIIKK